MELLDVLEEISVGYNQNDSKSKKLAGHVDEVRNILSKPGAIFENRSMEFSNYNISTENESITSQGSLIFYQGSYAIHTAIKHGNYEIDADVGFYIDEYTNFGIRDKINNLLENEFGHKYFVNKKKPCITIDFGDQYLVDIAIYSKNENPKLMSFHNSINGMEQKNIAAPKRIVKSFTDYLKDVQLKRMVIRLIKYFSKNASFNLKISDNNKIPSISYMILAYSRYKPDTDKVSEDNVQKELKNLANLCKNYFSNYQTLECPPLLISNTLYKVTDFTEVISVIDEIIDQIDKKNYASLMNERDFVSIKEKQKKKGSKESPLLGTMG